MTFETTKEFEELEIYFDIDNTDVETYQDIYSNLQIEEEY